MWVGHKIAKKIKMKLSGGLNSFYSKAHKIWSKITDYCYNAIIKILFFFIKLAEMLRSFSNSYIVIGGDFNCPLSNEDKVGGKNLSSKKNVIAKINHTMSTYDLVDVWRYLHPKNKQWTWSSSDKKIKCRLDYWLISRDNLRNVNSSEIEVFPHCDHSAVTLHIALVVSTGLGHYLTLEKLPSANPVLTT